MFSNTYNSSIRRYIVMMGDMFSRVKIVRKEDDSYSYRKVPITYASKEHFEMKLNSKLSINSASSDTAKVESILPMMYLNLIDIEYNSQFKTSLLNKVNNGISSQYNPTPVRLRFELGIYTRYLDDMFQIVEQIIPFFQPHFTTTITELFDKDITFERDIRVVMTSIDPDESIEGENTSRRRIQWSLFFDFSGWIYPPVFETKGEIRAVYLDFYNNPNELDLTGSFFESVDTRVDPIDTTKEEYEKNYNSKSSVTENIPIPKEPILRGE